MTSTLQRLESIGSDGVIEELEDGVRPLIVPARALVVSPRDAMSRKITTKLKEYGVSSYLGAPDKVGVFDMLDRDPRISVLFVRADELGSAHHDLLQSIIFSQPSLQAVVMGASRSLARDLKKFMNCETVANSTPAEEIVERVIVSLADHHYDLPVVEDVEGVMEQSLQDTDFNLTPMPPLLRVSATVLSELSAMIVVGGNDLNGRVTVSAPAVFYERLVLSWLGRPPESREDIWDCAGEFCNRVTGELRRHYLGRGLPSRQSIATIIEGTGVSIRCLTTKPALVVPFEADFMADPVYVELVLANKGPDQEEGAYDTQMNTSEITFL